MGYIYGQSYTDSITLRGGWDYTRENSDGTVEILARAHGALTAKTPYLVWISYDGPKTAALFDTGLASTTAAGSNNFFKVGVPAVAVSSDTDGWLQVGGYCGSVTTASITISQGNFAVWLKASVGAGTGITTALPTAASRIDGFAVAYTAASATMSHNLFLLNRFIMGTT
jgi:hypothetical protein